MENSSETRPEADSQEGGWINSHFTTEVCNMKTLRVCRAEGCYKKYSASSSHNTFKRHWSKEHRENIRKKSVFLFHDELHTSRLVKLVIDQQLEYSIVDSTAFKKFCQSLDKNKSILCRQTLSSLINSRKSSLKQLVKGELKKLGSIALTFDLWSPSKDGRGFGCISGHYFDRNGDLGSIILEFRRIKHPHDALTMSNFIRKMIESLGIHKQVISITTDNASNMEAAISDLKRSNLLTTDTPYGFTHFRCIAHVLHLGVSASLKKIKPLIREVKEVVLAIKSSGKRSEKFKEIQTELIQTGELIGLTCPLELIEDVQHRWNSTYQMLNRAFRLRVPISQFLRDTRELHSLGSIDWSKLGEIIAFLKPFCDLTRDLSSESNCTISLICVMVPKLLDHVSVIYDDDMLNDIARTVKSKLTSYVDKMYQPIVLLATALDPRFKMKSLSDEMRDQVLSKLNNMMDKENNHSGVIDDSRDLNSDQSIFDDVFAQDVEDELDLYFKSPCTHRATNVGQFWAVNSKSFPKLSTIARAILPIQATSVASERVFSTCGDLNVPKRNRLSDSSFENNILLKSWISFINCE